MNRDVVKLFMRVEGQRELCVGYAETMSDVPALLRGLADRWDDGMDEDDEPIFPPEVSGRRCAADVRGSGRHSKL